MKVLVGLGNPGPKYEGTRHNAGFGVVAELARRWGVEGRADPRFNAVIAEARVGSQRVLLVQPLTFMNLSGRAVQSLVNFYGVPIEDLVVIADDVDLSVGTLRLRKAGSSGGQKGMQSIIDHLGTGGFRRARLGIGPKPVAWETQSWVLSRFDPDERPAFDQTVSAAADALELWVRRDDFDLAMNRYNTPRPRKAKPEPALQEQSGQAEGSNGRDDTPGGTSPRTAHDPASG